VEVKKKIAEKTPDQIICEFITAPKSRSGGGERKARLIDKIIRIFKGYGYIDGFFAYY
jgi:hypothetical protein